MLLKFVSSSKEGIANSAVDLKMSVVKPLEAQQIIDAINYLKRNPNIVINGFRGTGIFELD